MLSREAANTNFIVIGLIENIYFYFVVEYFDNLREIIIIVKSSKFVGFQTQIINDTTIQFTFAWNQAIQES